MQTDIFIPARLDSTRLPEKHLQEINHVPIIKHLVNRLNSFADRGGRLLIMGKSILKPNKDLWFDIGADYLGQPNFDIDYTVISKKLKNENLVESPFLNYNAALRFKANDAEILASIKEPYFSRTPSSFSSHQNTPNKLENSEHAAIFQKNNITYVIDNKRDTK